MGSFGVEISIADNAGGLPKEILTALGQNQTSTKGGEHQGLGLKVAVDLSTEIGAQLDVASSELGTTFRIFLPGGLPAADEKR